MDNKGIEEMNILTFSTHEGYQHILSKCDDHYFYVVEQNKLGGVKGWDGRIRNQPDNVEMIIDYRKIIKKCDIVLYQTIEQYAGHKDIDLPKIILFHVCWSPNYDISMEENKQWLSSFGDSIKDIPKVFVSKQKQLAWDMEDNCQVINHGVDIYDYDEYIGKVPQALRACHYIKERDWWCGFTKMMDVVKKDIPYQIIGNNPSLIYAVYPNSFDGLKKFYTDYRLFLYSSANDMYPLSLLDAMATGMPIVSTMPELYKNDGFLNECLVSNDTDVLREHVKMLIADHEKAKYFGGKSREVVSQYFNMKRFTDEWNELFERVKDEKK